MKEEGRCAESPAWIVQGQTKTTGVSTARTTFRMMGAQRETHGLRIMRCSHSCTVQRDLMARCDMVDMDGMRTRARTRQGLL